MGIGKEVAEATLTVAKDKDVQKTAGGLFGKLFPYFGIKKKAVDTYITEIEKSDLSADAKFEAILTLKDRAKKLKKQKTVSEKAVESAKEGTDFSDESKVNEEWFERYMDSAGFVSDEMMQDIWGQILAKEFEKPGSTPPNRTRILTEITPIQAQAFKMICCMSGFVLEINEQESDDSTIKLIEVFDQIVVPYSETEFLNKNGVNLHLINELESIGLLHFQSYGSYMKMELNGKIVLCFENNKTKVVEFFNEKKGFPIGNILLTSAGECLKRITPIENLPGYYEAVSSYLEKQNIKFSNDPIYSASYSRINEKIEYQIVRRTWGHRPPNKG